MDAIEEILPLTGRHADALHPCRQRHRAGAGSVHGIEPVDDLLRPRVPVLDADHPTNWLTVRDIGVHLYGALVRAAPYLIDDASCADLGSGIYRASNP
jgi:hypothetical protein